MPELQLEVIRKPILWDEWTLTHSIRIDPEDEEGGA